MKSICYFHENLTVSIWNINFPHSHKHESNCKGGLQCFLIRVRIWRFKSFVPFFRRLQSLVPCIAKDYDQFPWGKISDFHQFSWSPAFSDIIFITEFKVFTPMADFLFLTLKWWFYSWCLLLFTLVSPSLQGQKSHIIVATDKKFHLQLVIGQKVISHLSWPIRICAVYCKSYIFFKFSLK